MSQERSTESAGSPGTVDGTPFFFGGGIFGVLHRPPHHAQSGWLICNPLGMEKTNAHRFNLEWARALATAGHWALRFDYRGTGDSAGSFEDYSIHDYLEDIGRAVEELERLSGGPCSGLFGLRLGAGLAAAYAAESGRTLDLGLWQPVVDGCKYRDELLRRAMANELVNSAGPHRSRDDFRDELARGLAVSVDGFNLKAPMHDSLAELNLESIGRGLPGRVFVAQINSRAGRPTPPMIKGLVSAYPEGTVEFETVRGPSVWLRTKTYRWRQEELFRKTLSWVGKHSRPSCVVDLPNAVMAGSIDTGEATERPVSFDVSGERVWGIFHDPWKPRRGAPSIVMTAAGALCRSGIFYTRLARELASAGLRVLRFDPSGVGDSMGDFDCDSVDEVYSRIDAGAHVPDSIAAIDFLENECGSPASVLIGLCGGGTTAVLTAAADDRVSGIAPLELPLKITPRDDAGQTRQKDPGRTLFIDQFSQHRGTLPLLALRRAYHSAGSRARLFRANLTKVFRKKSRAARTRRDQIRESLGDDANFPMMEAFKNLLEQELPVCCVFADTSDYRLFLSAQKLLLPEEDIDPSVLQIKAISGAEHTFTMPGQTDELVRSLLDWFTDPKNPWNGVEDPV
jgi:alpha/beta superfamily hydrolase